MATAEQEVTSQTGVMQFVRSDTGRRVLLIVGAAAVIAIMAGIWMWSQKPDYRVLFANFNDKDGGAIVAVLQQMNVPYKYSDGGGAILVPADQVHDLRLKLAAQDLPKGGNVGFEVMENQKLGTSQFVEQINYQRALEGELASTIESISAVQAARVHLALPKSSVFVRDQQKPTASVLLNLQPGRALDPGQVSAIVHLLASSVADLTPDNVTIVDQNGNLLSNTATKPDKNGLDPAQLKYIHALQQDIAGRIEAIITPIVGNNNVHAEVTADVDFSNSEQAAETYKPNPTPDNSSIRSLQTSETNSPGAGASGVPGALSNQPPAPATAPIVATPNAAPGAPGALATTNSSTSVSLSKQADTRYELDKTVRYTQQPMGGIKRLSVAVVVNYKSIIDKTGKIKQVPLSATEKAQVNDLAKEAMGYDQQRGDTLNIVNDSFAPTEDKIPDLTWWKQPNNIDLAETAGRYLLTALVLFIIYRKFLKPLMDKLINPYAKQEKHVAGSEHSHHAGDLTATDAEQIEGTEVHLSDQAKASADHQQQQQLEKIRQMSRDNPKIVANIVKGWINNE